MQKEHTKAVLLGGWMVGVLALGLTIDVESVPNWILFASVAVVPPVVARTLWREPAQTLAESIRAGRG